MTDVFVLRNQHNEFLNKSHEWIAAGDSKALYRSAYRDEVINEKVELTVKQPQLRIRLVAAEQQSNGRIFIEGKEALPKEPAHADKHADREVQLDIEIEAATTETAIPEPVTDSLCSK